MGHSRLRNGKWEIGVSKYVCYGWIGPITVCDTWDWEVKTHVSPINRVPTNLSSLTHTTLLIHCSHVFNHIFDTMPLLKYYNKQVFISIDVLEWLWSIYYKFVTRLYCISVCSVNTLFKIYIYNYCLYVIHINIF